MQCSSKPCFVYVIRVIQSKIYGLEGSIYENVLGMVLCGVGSECTSYRSKCIASTNGILMGIIKRF